VEILPGVNMIFDLPKSPKLKLIVINGGLTFHQPAKEKDLHL
jgi:hypothetical protein